MSTKNPRIRSLLLAPQPHLCPHCQLEMSEVPRLLTISSIDPAIDDALDALVQEGGVTYEIASVIPAYVWVFAVKRALGDSSQKSIVFCNMKMLYKVLTREQSMALLLSLGRSCLGHSEALAAWLHEARRFKKDERLTNVLAEMFLCSGDLKILYLLLSCPQPSEALCGKLEQNIIDRESRINVKCFVMLIVKIWQPRSLQMLLNMAITSDTVRKKTREAMIKLGVPSTSMTLTRINTHGIRSLICISRNAPFVDNLLEQSRIYPQLNGILKAALCPPPPLDGLQRRLQAQSLKEAAKAFNEHPEKAALTCFQESLWLAHFKEYPFVEVVDSIQSSSSDAASRMLVVLANQSELAYIACDFNRLLYSLQTDTGFFRNFVLMDRVSPHILAIHCCFHDLRSQISPLTFNYGEKQWLACFVHVLRICNYKLDHEDSMRALKSLSMLVKSDEIVSLMVSVANVIQKRGLVFKRAWRIEHCLQLTLECVTTMAISIFTLTSIVSSPVVVLKRYFALGNSASFT